MNKQKVSYTLGDLDEVWGLEDEETYEDEEDDEFYDNYPNKIVYNLFKSSKPSDYYFCTLYDINGDGYVNVCVVPCLYFDKNKCMFDQGMPIEHLLPRHFSVMMESVWDSEKDVFATDKEMLTLGFKQNKEFSELCHKEFEIAAEAEDEEKGCPDSCCNN